MYTHLHCLLYDVVSQTIFSLHSFWSKFSSLLSVDCLFKGELNNNKNKVLDKIL